jgi:hypothetical protein
MKEVKMKMEVEVVIVNGLNKTIHQAGYCGGDATEAAHTDFSARTLNVMMF